MKKIPLHFIFICKIYWIKSVKYKNVSVEKWNDGYSVKIHADM